MWFRSSAVYNANKSSWQQIGKDVHVTCILPIIKIGSRKILFSHLWLSLAEQEERSQTHRAKGLPPVCYASFVAGQGMERFLQALGFGSSKPEYADKIPENLTEGDFRVQDVSHWALSLQLASQPSSSSYDQLGLALSLPFVTVVCGSNPLGKMTTLTYNVNTVVFFFPEAFCIGWYHLHLGITFSCSIIA